MPDQPSRSSHQILVADHVWEAFSQMSRDMGVDRDSLISQALFAFARQHGYLAPGLPATRPALVESLPEPLIRPPPPVEEPTPVRLQPVIVSEKPRPSPVSAPPIPDEEADAPEPIPFRVPRGVESNLAPAEEPFVLANSPLSAAPPPMDEELHPAPSLVPPPPFDGAPSLAVAGPELVLYAEGREVDRVAGPRFLIGRGKHCDLIINSGKVSREHAAIIRDGQEFFIEDLGSSNGTWFDKKRITRRKIEDGDEYFVCSEKITCRLG
jgi:hypothetical protein